MSARMPTCLYCSKKGLPFKHASKRGTYYGVEICIESLVSELYLSNCRRLRAENELAKLSSKPLLNANPKEETGSWAAVAAANRDAKVVAKIEKETAQIKAQERAKARAISEKSHQQHLENLEKSRQHILEVETRMQERREKKRIADEEKKVKENDHVANMIEKWGEHRWHRMVKDTDDDCGSAVDLRCKEMEQDERDFYENIEREKEWANDWNKEREAKKKRRAEARATMTREEFAMFEYQASIDEMDDEEAYFGSGYIEMYCKQRQRRADAERLALWHEKQKAKEV